jgi:hypothetical protein
MEPKMEDFGFPQEGLEVKGPAPKMAKIGRSEKIKRGKTRGEI